MGSPNSCFGPQKCPFGLLLNNKRQDAVLPQGGVHSPCVGKSLPPKHSFALCSFFRRGLPAKSTRINQNPKVKHEITRLKPPFGIQLGDLGLGRGACTAGPVPRASEAKLPEDASRIRTGSGGCQGPTPSGSPKFRGHCFSLPRIFFGLDHFSGPEEGQDFLVGLRK